MSKKIQLMYELHGRKDGCFCRDCLNFKRHYYHCKTYRKCAVYGESHSEATDWAGRNVACGLYNVKYTGRPVIEFKSHFSKNKTVEQLDGQIFLLEE